MAGDEAVVPPRKGGTGTTTAAQPPSGDEAQAGLRCPRCDSPNTKFCYYNNYSLSQPRHFCKTCRRYWTKGGALRNVPVGGGCRKNKRSRSSSSASSAAASRLSLNLPGPVDQHQNQQADQQHAAVRMGGGFHGVVDFHLGSISMLPGPGGLQLHSSSPTSAVVSHGQYVPFGEWPAPPGDANNNNVSGQGMSGIASSIESLSYINQDLHWKLQQQRVATMFLGPPVASPHSHSHDAQAHHHHQFGAAGAFLQMETTTGAVPPAATSWFMQDSSSSPYPPPAPLPSSSSPCRPPVAAAAASCSNINSGRSSGGGGGDVDNATSNNSCGGSDIPSWGDISTFAMLP